MKRRFLSLFAGVLLVGLVPAVAQASTPGGVDQWNPVYGISSATSYHQAQTFTAGQSGVLYGVDLFLNVQSPQTVQVFIRAVDGSGLPTGANLATSSVSLPVMQDWIHFPLSGSLSITTGSKYAIVFDLGTSFTTYSYWGYAYGGGQGVRATDTSDTSWSNNWPSYGIWDYAFQTYVGPSTPGSLNRMVLYPSSATIDAGGDQYFFIDGLDASNNDLGPVNVASRLSIAGGGSCETTYHTCTSTVAGDHRVTAKDGSITSAPATLHVAAGDAVALRLTVATNPTVAGAAHSVTVTALDTYGNVATGFSDTIQFTSSDARAVLPADYTFTGADAGVHKFTNGLTLKTAGTMYITATDEWNSSIHSTKSVTVTPGAARTFGVSVAANPFAAGSAHSVTVKALDAYGNTVTGYTGTVHFSSTDSQALLPTNYTFLPGDNGSHKFTNGVTLKTAGSQSVTANDTATTSIKGSGTVTVTPGTAKTLTVSIAANPFPAGSAHSVTVKALDAYGNVATGYTGTIHFTSSDGEAVLPPGNYTFSGADAGTHKFTNGVTLNTAGSQSVTATDNSHSSITGSQTVTVN